MHSLKNIIISFFLTMGVVLGTESQAAVKHTQVEIKTSMGIIQVELYNDKAPVTVKNFLEYAKAGFYNGTIFHRVINNFMIQGGGFTADMKQKQVKTPVENEAYNGIKNDRGTIAMARTSDPHSATAQFFINVVDNGFLNYTSKTSQGWGYAVFGKVVKGMDVVDQIKGVGTGSQGSYRDVPNLPIVIQAVTVVE